MANELLAAQALDRVTGGKMQQGPFIGVLMLGLLLGNFGDLAGEETHHWLGRPLASFDGPHLQIEGGVIPVFASAEEGARAFVEVLGASLDFGVMGGLDTGELAWAVLQAGLLPVVPSPRIWRVVKLGLEAAAMRLEAALGAPRVWQDRGFRPPSVQADESSAGALAEPDAGAEAEAWQGDEAPAGAMVPYHEGASMMSHAEAEDLLRRYLPPDVSSSERLAMLTWAFVATHYGFLQGQETYNWSFQCVPVKEEGVAPPGYVIHETGEVAIRIFPSRDAGMIDFLRLMETCDSLDKEDFSLLAEEMLKKQAFGARVEFTKESWGDLLANLGQEASDISRETGLPLEGWTVEHTPEKIVKTLEKKQKEELEPVAKKPFPWHWLAVGVGVLGIGYFATRKDPVSSTDKPDEKKDAA